MKKFDSGQVDGAGFQSVLEHLVAPIEVRPTSGFSGSIRSSWHRDVHLSRLAASEHVASGRPAAQAGESVLVFVRMVRGNARVAQGGRVAEVHPGDMFVYAADRSYTLHFDSEYEAVGVVLPLARLTGHGRKVASLTAMRLGNEESITSTVGCVMEQLEDRLVGLPEVVSSGLIRTIAEAVDTLSTQVVVASGLSSFERVGRLQEALELIDEHLSRPELSVEFLASALHVSRRTLYSIFDEAGMAVAETIRLRRLDRCREQLADPAYLDESVASVGARWGFLSPTHFSTAFRGAVGCSPSEWRARQMHTLPEGGD